jgi:hypothetical protein
VCVCVCVGKQNCFEQKLHTATKHTEHSKEGRSMQIVQVLKAIKWHEPQELEFLNMFRFPNFFLSCTCNNSHFSYDSFVISMKNCVLIYKKINL